MSALPPTVLSITVSQYQLIMRFISITFALAGTLLVAVKAAPVEALPLESSLIDPRAAATQCGEYHTFEEYLTYPLHANGHYENIREPQHISEIINHSCGICMVFAGRDAQGDVLWSGGPGQGSATQVKGGQSYFCIFGQKSLERSITEPRAPATQCGQFQKIEEEGPMPLYANGHYENLEEATHMITIINQSCGICMVFKERDAQGDIMWSGGPGQEALQQVRGGQSYFCIYGKKSVDEAVEAINNLRAVNDERDTSAACGTYTDKVADHPLELLVNGKTYENVALGTHMISISNISCGICMVFKGRDATGEITWSGGPGQGAGKEVLGSQSYFCVYGKVGDHTFAGGRSIDSRPPEN
ncbi:hypothetical protein BDU57DRAFT_536887 [Ampelomyces quisqualis]|uniref:Uncharacterized protein n=1 Tax=Ampelomyces quisqualis TaxID=50730 RepID=A0A6A5QW66_AMPQU|nr:hypothetical protein BDU57DRAFT_536887 [Ampelomyces quisqualis]